MINHNLDQGLAASRIDPANSAQYQSWLAGFPAHRTQKLKQLLAKHKLEVSEFVDIVSIISEIPDAKVELFSRHFDIYKAHLQVKDLNTGKDYSIPFLAVFSKGGTVSSSDLAIPIALAEAYAMETFFATAETKVVGIADLSKTRLSTNMTTEQIAAIVKMYSLPNFYKQVTVHFLGMGFVNSILALLGRISSDTKVISNKLVMSNNMDTGIIALADIIKSLIRSSDK